LPEIESLISSLKSELKVRFEQMLDKTCQKYEPLYIAAASLHPLSASLLSLDEQKEAAHFIRRQVNFHFSTETKLDGSYSMLN